MRVRFFWGSRYPLIEISYEGYTCTDSVTLYCHARDVKARTSLFSNRYLDKLRDRYASLHMNDPTPV